MGFVTSSVNIGYFHQDKLVLSLQHYCYSSRKPVSHLLLCRFTTLTPCDSNMFTSTPKRMIINLGVLLYPLNPLPTIPHPPVSERRAVKSVLNMLYTDFRLPTQDHKSHWQMTIVNYMKVLLPFPSLYTWEYFWLKTTLLVKIIKCRREKKGKKNFKPCK